MINHARTLLMNTGGERQPDAATAYDAYVPPYAPVAQLPAGLAAARALLFGTRPDYQGMCMRAAQCLTLVAATPYAGYLLGADSRVTYDFSGLDPQRFPEVVTSVSGGAVSLAVVGDWRIAPGDGRGLATWTICWGADAGTVTGTETAECEVARESVVKLPGSTLVVSASAQPEPGTTWQISFRDMVAGLPDAIDAVLASEQAMRELFPVARGEPWTTFYALTTNAMFPHRAAGVVLAMIGRMELLRDV